MLRLITSLSFLYAVSIVLLLAYGYLFYRDFRKRGMPGKRFPFVFLLIAAACMAFLWINMHAPLNLKTYSNLHHSFLRHEGFAVNRQLELGNADTSNYSNAPYNRFVLSKKEQQTAVTSPYSEEPFYVRDGERFKIASKTFPAAGHSVSFSVGDVHATLRMTADDQFQLEIGNETVALTRRIKKGISAWNLFREEERFIRSPYFSNLQAGKALGEIYLVRDELQRAGGHEAKWFISGRLFELASGIRYDERPVSPGDLAFESPIPAGSQIAWGIAFLDNNKNRFTIGEGKADSFYVFNQFPVSYPMTEERGNDWTRHAVAKFLVADPADIVNMPPTFREGFLFDFFEDGNDAFEPVLLTYHSSSGNDSIRMRATTLDGVGKEIFTGNGNISLPAKSGGFHWMLSVRNSFDWQFDSFNLSASQAQWLIFGSLLFFVLLVLAAAIATPPGRQSWVWQVFSCVVLVLLTTRFFLYWRYKSFPPFEGLDLPSIDQLNNAWNFGIILLATIGSGIVFGHRLFGLLIPVSLKRRLGGQGINNNIGRLSHLAIAKRMGPKGLFFGGWLLLLVVTGAVAFASDFDAAICRHLALSLAILYFAWAYFSYRFSPLVTASEKCWWRIDASRPADLIVSNPVKVLLSISLLATFVFIDIGFAIVFLNFLLFNEAFLCLHYAIGGLSAGSRRNSRMFGAAGILYGILFITNLLFAPLIIRTVINLPQAWYVVAYALFACLMTYHLLRLYTGVAGRKKILHGAALMTGFFLVAFLFFPREKILEKAAMTKYRIDVLTMPVEEAIESAYAEGDNYRPVIRAAQNQWFINTFIDEKNNPAAGSVGFKLLPHAPQNKGAKYNAQATDLVASRFVLAEHGKWSILLYVLLLVIPAALLSSFYKLYPDFNSRVNERYPVVTAGFSILNYLLISALLVILAATGRYIFFGQDMPFASILSKQSILFPLILIVIVVLLFGRGSLQYYANRAKLIPGMAVFAVLAVLLFFVKPVFNTSRDFNAGNLGKSLGDFVQLRLQPLMDHFDSSRATRHYPLAKKDKLFADSLGKMIAAGFFGEKNNFFVREAQDYSRADFGRHVDPSRMLYLDISGGKPVLDVNENYFQVDPPPHLQLAWRGNVYGDTANFNIAIADMENRQLRNFRVRESLPAPSPLAPGLSLVQAPAGEPGPSFYLVNTGPSDLQVTETDVNYLLRPNDSLGLRNPWTARITDAAGTSQRLVVIEPDAYMKNYFVNGSRYYVYPLGEKFIWARNFAESIAADYTDGADPGKNAFVSLDFELMDSLSTTIGEMMMADTSYYDDAEYGICVADGNGRLVAIADFIKGLKRPDPNDKAGFNKVITGDNGYISQALLRKQIGNVNLLRLNPGPGSTLKPIVFTAIASQLDLDWNAFASEGFSEKQTYYGSQKVAEYDFEKNNGRISSVADYLRFSDNYYHSNVLLLGSYRRQDLLGLLNRTFAGRSPGAGLHWPNFTYRDSRYWLDGFQNWPGYSNGEVNFGSDSSFVSIGLRENFSIYTHFGASGFDGYHTGYDSSLFRNAGRKSGFILPEYPLFDQQGEHVNRKIPYDVFASCFRGHVKGSSQVMIPPVKMAESYGKLVTQNRNYSLTLNPYAEEPVYHSFLVDQAIHYPAYLDLLRSGVFRGLSQALNSGTAASLGTLLKKSGGFHYYAKTGTTGDNNVRTKSKLMAVVISEKDLADPAHHFRKNKFYTVYFTLQNGPAKQNEAFQAKVIRLIEQSAAFRKYMGK